MRTFVAVVATLGAGTLAGPGGAYAAVPSGNLVQNPGAEAGAGADDQNGGFPPPQWGIAGGFTAVKYGTEGFPDETVSSSIGGGANFFSGGPNDPTSVGEQMIDVASAAPEIDAGQVAVELRGHLGGYFTDDDNAKVTAAFEDESGDTTFTTLQIGPVTAADRSNQTTLLPRSTTAEVPVGTRRIRFTVTTTRADGAYNDGYADNLSLMLMLDQDPTATNDSTTVAQEAGATAIDVLANDADPDGGPKLVASVTQPAHGQVFVADGGTGLSYRPNGAGYCNSQVGGAPDTFSYTLNGGSTATVSVTVTCRVSPSGPSCASSASTPARAAATLTGTPASDALIGTAQSDRISGLGGNDCMLGLGGNDAVDGGTGDDRIRGDGRCPVGTSDAKFCTPGSTGNDRLSGGSGSDVIDGEAGNDIITGGLGTDRIRGMSGNDRLAGSSGADLLAGGSGNDRLSGGSGTDRLTGNSGADRITGGSGRDRFSAGAGNDRVRARDGTGDTVNCGSGVDRVTADRIDSVARNCERVSRR